MNLTTAEARHRFSTAVVARLATVAETGQPHLIPVTFAAAADNKIVIAIDHKPKTTRNLKRLRNIEANPKVTVLADHYDPDWSHLWWARADGTARLLHDPATMAAPIELLAAKYPQYQAQPPAGPVIEITVHTWTGWQA